MKRPIACAALAVIACGPVDRTSPSASGVDAGGAPNDDDDDGVATITGTVWAPGNAPGMVPVGHEIPVAGAMVYLGLVRPEPIPQRVECVPCTEAPPAAQVTDARGGFQLRSAPGTYWLVIQKAQFRLEREVIITSDQVLGTELTTLPSVHDPDAGTWIPHIALAAGDYDAMESILGKMGIGQVSSNGSFIAPSATGRFDVYFNGSWDMRSVAVGRLSDLVSDLDRMMTYHVIFIPCAGDANRAALRDQKTLRNLREYVRAGGRLYVTDWSGEWSDNVFPEQIELRGGVDTPASAYDPAADRWFPRQFGNADGSPDYSSPDGEAVDPGLASWLDGQVGYDGWPIDAEAFFVEGNWDHIRALHDVEVGVDEEGQPIIDSPKRYVIGSDGAAGGKKTLTATFEPAGCGRVLYSTYHTTESVHVGLAPQERVLLYLLLEIGVCKDDPDVE
ncbi:MAG TPA: hypothetical protein VIG06_12010 [Kofleriaceae bacterium]|jgi:hypothetical protein